MIIEQLQRTVWAVINMETVIIVNAVETDHWCSEWMAMLIMNCSDLSSTGQ
jgi:hypothetical protein